MREVLRMKIRFNKPEAKGAIISCVIALAIGMVILILTTINFFRNPIDPRMFASMEELSAFDEYIVAELDPAKDKRLDDLDYLDKYTKILEHDGKKYKLYAYKFKNQSDARAYCSSSNEKFDKDFRYSYGNYAVAYYHEYAYSIYCEDHNSFVKFYNRVTKDFSIGF